MELLVTFALKSVLIAGVTLALLHFLRGRSAAERGMVAHLGLLSLVLFPLGAMFLPQLVVSAPLMEAAPTMPAQLPAAPITDNPPLPAAEAFQAAASPEPWWPLLYGIPVVLLLAVTLIAVLRLVTLRTKASVLVEPSWLSALAHAQRRMNFKNGTALLTSSDLKSPISWGLFRPVILLNEKALGAKAEAEAIIAHELAHVRGLDWAKLLLGRIATALFWFNPLVWILAREAHQLREETADDAVLAADVEGVDYAQLLVGVARHDCRGLLLGAHGVAPGKGSLTRRVQRVLDSTLPRTPMGKGFAAGLFMGVVAAATPLAAITFSPRASDGASEAGVAVVKANPADSLPSLVAQSVATATAVTTEAVSVAVSGREAAVASAAAAQDAAAIAADRRALAEEVRLAMVHPHPAPQPPVSPQPPVPPKRVSADEAIDRAIASKALGITPEYAASIRAALGGMQIDDGDLMGLRAVGATPDWVRAMARAGSRTSDVGDLTGARAVGVSPTYVAELAGAGVRNVSLGDLTAMRALGITATSIQKLRDAGYTGLTPNRIIELRAVRIKEFATGRSQPPSNWPPNLPRRPRPETPEPPEAPEPPKPDAG
ncbi:beta-lactamase regulating signal transducer with metallopeptidase domain [Sphingomonas kaistensis]|uniref:Beta-lactamase regulating signal transducer with metallopeptidase domain n=1 Tax=Sphingomonas kaistensis TaxID=298708 RepID=A0A7X6BHY8_9SPHN|nr:M56 family metallopeptidase [Sphingomonas kaistensis]NJC06622.1 beta-lactamase regulating signal transducer with metallopeptidase domain [Sphingomonas kaistensis]